MAKKTVSTKKTLKTAVKTAAGVAAGFAATMIGVACLTAFYCKQLMGVEYDIDENGAADAMPDDEE